MKIYVFINVDLPHMGMVEGMAVREDGTVIASHLSSNRSWAKVDLGVTSQAQHDKYAASCSEGYEIEWVDDPLQHPGLLAAKEQYLRREQLRQEQYREFVERLAKDDQACFE